MYLLKTEVINKIKCKFKLPKNVSEKILNFNPFSDFPLNFPGETRCWFLQKAHSVWNKLTLLLGVFKPGFLYNHVWRKQRVASSGRDNNVPDVDSYSDVAS